MMEANMEKYFEDRITLLESKYKNDFNVISKRIEAIWRTTQEFQGMLLEHKNTKSAHDISTTVEDVD